MKGAADMSPVDAFVVMEELQAGDLLRFVGGGLHAVKRVVMGSGLLTPAVQDLAVALLAGEVPRAWSKRWEGPEKPQGFLRGLVMRRVALSRWVAKVSRCVLYSSRECGCSAKAYVTPAQMWACLIFLSALVCIKVRNGEGVLEGEVQLADLFNPGTFLNALRQQTAREAGCSIDELVLTSSWDQASGCCCVSTWLTLANPWLCW
jgi:dynein heavy chain 2